MANDTAVYHAFDDNNVWHGMGTREAISARGPRSDGIVHWCPRGYLDNGWRGLNIEPRKDFNPFAPSRHDFNL
jgi:hypothetical protein